ncbi:DUF1819 family protein [Synechocystis sp. PCC 6714]|uniref:DUF1819 family protein n=1 Tax=Synechocystis sp. (strain PCC 6714) TaxID=1147 RepID=UPI0003FCB4CA|nr:DUF1819 family protein [Synechocystis sp. PCC 6714]AIE76140.1 Inner membrane protein [Synechocystis sp. PCC 6714]
MGTTARYTVSIARSGLRLRESRIIADLLLQKISDGDWQRKILEENVLQIGNVESIKRIAGLLRYRIEALGESLWLLIRDGDRQQATQTVFAGAVKESPLLGDFMDVVIREQRGLFAPKLENWMWSEYIEVCRGRDPFMPSWGPSTVKRLRSSVFRILSEVGYLKDSRSLMLQNVFIDDQLRHYLREKDEKYALRCLEAME